VGDAVSLQMVGTDHDGDTLIYSANGLPSGLTINSSTGLISGTISQSASVSAVYAVSVSVTDGTNVAVQNFNWNLAEIELVNPGDASNFVGDAVSIPVLAHDDFNQPISYSAVGLPSGVGINATTGLISGTVGAPMSGDGVYSVTLTATAGVYSSSTTFNWSVSQLSLTAPSNPINADGDAVSLTVASNAPAGTNLQFSASGLPSGLTINNTGVKSGTIAAGADANSPYMVMVTSSDGQGAMATTTFTWTVTHLVLINPGDQTYAWGDNVNLQLLTDYHGMGSLTYTASGLPSGITINSQTGQISGQVPNNGVQGSYVIQAQVKDPAGDRSNVFFTMNIQDYKVLFGRRVILGFLQDGNKITALHREISGTVSDPSKVNDVTFKIVGQKRAEISCLGSGGIDQTTRVISLDLAGLSATPATVNPFIGDATLEAIVAMEK
jgi:hypothetical protein